MFPLTYTNPEVLSIYSIYFFGKVVYDTNWQPKLSLLSQNPFKTTRLLYRPYFELLSAGSKTTGEMSGVGSFSFIEFSVTGSLWAHLASPELPIAT